ncbi:hypothetical protein TELCIR_03930 [Teladorsagia circumcincta]|uniref:Uncharacterized protein n=1 Tax=Teladorsagia circumcincta TaxID=45464 RepID=A0A2G9UUZ0_TELCI|nr:hypothetical protein TELCIR_03930 [Teladorsagia circumcincta]
MMLLLLHPHVVYQDKTDKFIFESASVSYF